MTTALRGRKVLRRVSRLGWDRWTHLDWILIWVLPMWRVRLLLPMWLECWVLQTWRSCTGFGKWWITTTSAYHGASQRISTGLGWVKWTSATVRTRNNAVCAKIVHDAFVNSRKWLRWISLLRWRRIWPTRRWRERRICSLGVVTIATVKRLDILRTIMRLRLRLRLRFRRRMWWWWFFMTRSVGSNWRCIRRFLDVSFTVTRSYNRKTDGIDMSIGLHDQAFYFAL